MRLWCLEITGDLLLEGFDVRHELLAGRLEEEVPVGEPGRVAEPNKLEKLREDGKAVDGTHHSAGEPDGRESTNGVDDEGRLVLNLVPLQL